MQLIEINKERYRKHLNQVIIACIASLVVGCLAVAQILIALFPDESGSHFHWNLTGVIVTCLVIAWVLNKYRQHEFMTELVYVWELKQALTKINRKMLKLEAAAKAGDVNALISLQYCYAGSRQLWKLDDNTIVMDELAVKQVELDTLANQYNLTLNAEDYDPAMLQGF
ncbi:DUF3087 domain-containing protein [Paraglaciecola aquimarina]|uniref:DUF3087 domain-containing protein n=1 Tax=Paraglaciecola algarum TaxID=3050085 RepID=A0ABS9D8X0_9ALTE|nr:DUF3087 domain-containing protein [Paraglaciecola sp. G1-23]MCF2949411.1 DUF3087 domain-containing protein [Paraglaciecola sp. G1-23]